MNFKQRFCILIFFCARGNYQYLCKYNKSPKETHATYAPAAERYNFCIAKQLYLVLWNVFRNAGTDVATNSSDCRINAKENTI